LLKKRLEQQETMTQIPEKPDTSEPAVASAIPLPDVFSREVSALFTRVRPAIVQVHNTQRGGGTGIVWRPDGYIITNNHVVAGKHGSIQIHLTDGRTLPAQIIQRHPRIDLALLKADMTGQAPLQALPIGDSTSLRVGAWVFAIGHPWGQRWSMTAGIVSTISTIQIAPDLKTQYIKSDVRLAPGNSGGPLLDADGNVIGVNAMIFGGDLSVSITSDVVTKWLAGFSIETP
jgi:serine protease Do